MNEKKGKSKEENLLNESFLFPLSYFLIFNFRNSIRIPTGL